MKWYFLPTILLFSMSVFADDTPVEQQEVPSFDSRCMGPLEYTSNMLKARLGGISEDDLVDDLIEAEVNGMLGHLSLKTVYEMIQVIHMVYDEEIDVDTIEGVQTIYLKINDWCSGQLPPEKLEDRRWYDDDDDGFPDYDGEGNPIEELEALKPRPINT